MVTDILAIKLIEAFKIIAITQVIIGVNAFEIKPSERKSYLRKTARGVPYKSFV